ncbi:MFS transporter [Singulisphaera sp. PoT]|uniref:MFS transporter n=1 Tax=Singulisphaera sp. PoT TaxID=3411797 RepID=UPI003BF5D213
MSIHPGESSSSLELTPNRRDLMRLGLLFGSLAFCQGICEPSEGLSAQPVRSLLLSWSNGVASVAAVAGVVALPWILKPVFGLLTDFVPIAGSRRRSYLLGAGILSTLSFLAATLASSRVTLQPWLIAWLAIASAAVACADVATDALMIELGQPLRFTGRLQAIQWGCLYASGLVVGVVGGALSEGQRQCWAILGCSAVSCVSLLMIITSAHEPRRIVTSSGLMQASRRVVHALQSPTMLAVGGFLFLWNFNPFSNAVLHIHLTRGLQFSEQVFGLTITTASLSSIVACVLYGTYCRRIPMATLARLSIVLGMVSTLGYLLVEDEHSLVLVTIATGFTYMTATLIQLDLAARACPGALAGTLFATLMALENLAASLSTTLGGFIYEAAQGPWGSRAAFRFLVLVGCLTSAGCWLFLDLIPFRDLSGESKDDAQFP